MRGKKLVLCFDFWRDLNSEQNALERSSTNRETIEMFEKYNYWQHCSVGCILFMRNQSKKNSSNENAFKRICGTRNTRWSRE